MNCKTRQDKTKELGGMSNQVENFCSASSTYNKKPLKTQCKWDKTSQGQFKEISACHSVVGEIVLLAFNCWGQAWKELGYPTFVLGLFVSFDHPAWTPCCSASLSTHVVSPAGFVWPLLLPWGGRSSPPVPADFRSSAAPHCASQLVSERHFSYSGAYPPAGLLSWAPSETKFSHQWDLYRCNIFSSTSWTLVFSFGRAFSTGPAFSSRSLNFGTNRKFHLNFQHDSIWSHQTLQNK